VVVGTEHDAAAVLGLGGRDTPDDYLSRARGVVGGGVEARDPVLPVVLVAGGVVDVEPPGVGVVRVDGDAERAALAARDPPRLPVRLVVGFVVDGTHVDGVLGCRDRRERVAVEAPNAADALGEKQRAVGERRRRPRALPVP